MKKVLLSCVVGIGLALAGAVSAATPEPPGFNVIETINFEPAPTLTLAMIVLDADVVSADGLRSISAPVLATSDLLLTTFDSLPEVSPLPRYTIARS